MRKEETMFENLLTSFVGKLNDFVSSLSKPEEQNKEESNMLLWKDKSGDWRWLSVFTNKYMDLDYEILSSKAHEDYVNAVDNKEWPMPELWHWHTPGTKWGTGDMVAFDKERGFVIASGYIDKGHEKEAEAMANLATPIKVSHGMPISEIVRDKDEPLILTRYRTIEISDLPAKAAANKLTNFAIKKENVMAIPDEKKKYLEDVGLSKDDIQSIEDKLDSSEKAAKVLELSSKETTESIPVELEPVAEEQVEYVSKEEVAVAMKKLSDIIEMNTKTLVENVSILEAQVQQLSERFVSLERVDGDKVSEKALQTPTASLADLIALSVIGKKEAKVDARSTLVKSAPFEAEEQVTSFIGIPFIDKMLSQRPSA